MKAYNIADLREIAQRRLPKGLFEFVDRGAEDEVSLAHNQTALRALRFRPRMLVGVEERSPEIDLFGRRQKFPLIVAPTGMAGLLWYEGEIAAARAAAAAGIPYTLANSSLTPLEKIAEAADGELWFQAYLRADISVTHRTVARALAAGYKALTITVDTPVAANREYNRRNGFSAPFGYTPRNIADVLLHPRWLCGVLGRYLMTTGIPRHENYPSRGKVTGQTGDSALRNSAVNWDHLRGLRRLWPNPLLVKGILHPDDARLAVECGADGIIVSNHGGRILDGALAPIEALPDIVEAVGARCTVIVDGGFRRGADVVKALALGARAVQVGRPPLYGLAANGEAGVRQALTIFRDEIDRVMALAGCRATGDITPALLHNSR